LKKISISQAQLKTYEHEQSLLDMIAGVTSQKSYYMGRGLADGLSERGTVGMLVN
jgi:hypothetical protein